MNGARNHVEAPSAGTRVLERMAWVTGRAGTRSERAEQVLLLVAAAVFVAATIWAWRAHPEARASYRVGWLAVATSLGLVSVGLNAVEFHVAARMLDRHVPVVESLRVSVLGSAANLLPIPGAAAVRLRALRQRGVRTRAGIVVLLAVGIAWVATAALLAGLLLAPGRGQGIAAVAFLAAALGGAAAVVVLLRFVRPSGPPRRILLLVSVEVVSVLVSGVRLLAVAKAAGLVIAFPGAMAVNLGTILSHVVGIAPGGLGVREVLAGVAGGLGGVAVGVGVLVSVVERLVMSVVLAIVSMPLLARSRRGTGLPVNPVEGTREP